MKTHVTKMHVHLRKYHCIFKHILIQAFTDPDKTENLHTTHKHCCHGKAISITHSECVSVALVIQHTMCICRITLSHVACLGLHIIPHFLIKCVFWFPLSAIFLIFKRILWHIIINVHRSSRKVPIMLVKL